MKFTLLLVLVFINACIGNTPKESKKIKELAVDQLEFPLEIRQRNLESSFDSAKWALYSIHCDKFCRFYEKMKIADTPQFGTLELRFDKMLNFHDTTELKFHFYYHDSIKCDVNTISNYASLTSGAAFKGNSDSIIYYTTEDVMNRFYETGSASRYYVHLQPTVISYIKENRDKLNIWFKRAAIKHKILDY